MATFKLILSKGGKATTYELKDQKANAFLGLKVRDVIDGTVIGVEGKIKITGGSDRAGFPMRADVHGSGKRYVLLSRGVGFSSARKGERRRKLVRGNIISEEIYQVNAITV